MICQKLMVSGNFGDCDVLRLSLLSLSNWKSCSRSLFCGSAGPEPADGIWLHRAVLSVDCNWGELGPAIWSKIDNSGEVK